MYTHAWRWMCEVGRWWEAKNVRIICFTSSRACIFFFFSIFDGNFLVLLCSICWWRWRWISGLLDIFLESRRPPSIWVLNFEDGFFCSCRCLTLGFSLSFFQKNKLKPYMWMTIRWIAVDRMRNVKRSGKKGRRESKKFDFCRWTCDSKAIHHLLKCHGIQSS